MKKPWFTKYNGELPGRKCRWKTRFDELLRSNEKTVIVNWQELGYKNYKVAQSCINNAVKRIYPERLEMSSKDGIIYLKRKDI
jgi:hypothetical protein